MYDYSKLRGRIAEVCGTQSAFAKAMGLSDRAVSLKMNQERGFKQKDIEKALDVLHLTKDDIQHYFFAM